MSGKLFLCATPIGNLGDITLRVLETLETVDLIAAEDTRHSLKLLNHFAIKTPMTSYHEFNKIDKAHYLIGQMSKGLNIALVTDAGTPAISDPGEELVKMCYAAGIEVTSLPGPSACITALTLSGLRTRRFCFEGFLPADKKESALVLERLKNELRTTVFYEAPHRLAKTLKALMKAIGNRQITLSRELTKRYETVMRTTLEDALSYYKEHEPKGEYVIIVEGADIEKLHKEAQGQWEKITIQEHMNIYLNQGMLKMEAMKAVAADRGLRKRDIYQQLTNADKERGEGHE